MEGINGEHISANASTEQIEKCSEEHITATSKHPAVASSSKIDTVFDIQKNHEAVMSEFASKMVKVCSSLHEVVGIAKV